MKIKAVVGAALAAMMCAPMLSAQNVQRFTAGKANEFGLVYSLPLTRVDVVVEAERTVKRPGEFYRYSKKYLNIDPIAEEQTSWRIKNVVILCDGVPDPEQEYLVQFKAGSTPFMLLDSNGVPITVNAESAKSNPEPEVPQPVAASPTPLEGPAARQAVTEEMLQSKSSAKRAELAAAKIFELRQSRNDIISGQADNMPSDGKAMQIALDNLAAQEAALTAMFAGTTQVSTDVVTYQWTPEATDDPQRIILGRLSQIDGLVDADDLSGAPIYLDINVVKRGVLPTTEKGEPKKFPKGGLAYRVPGEAKVSVVYDGATLASQNIDVAQLGVVFGIDPSLFTDKKAPAYVIFDPNTGAVWEMGTVK